MYADNSIGIILRSSNENLSKDKVGSIPGYVDRIYIASEHALCGDFGQVDGFSGDPRIVYVAPDNGDSGYRSLLQKVIKDRMDIIVIWAPNSPLNPDHLSHLVDPIVSGKADYTEEICKRSGALPGAGNHLSQNGVVVISQWRTVPWHSVPLDSASGAMAASRQALKTSLRKSAQKQGMQILAAIPCYNEEVTIGSVVLKAFRHVDAVLVIDDGSRDCTGQVAEDAGAIVIKHASNRGKAAGVIAAVRYAKEHGFDILVLLDGDGQHKAEEIPTIVQPLLSGEADAVIGSRFLQNNGTIPLYRRLGQKVLTLVTNARSSKKLTDSQSGFRGLNVKALNSLPLESDGYSIESDMITFLSKNGIAMQEVPISAVYDVPNKHKKNPFYHGYDILARMVGEIGYQRPMLLFGITGIVLLFSGIAFGFHAFAYYHSTHTLPFGPALASSIGLILGMLLIVAGLILNSLVLIMNKE